MKNVFAYLAHPFFVVLVVVMFHTNSHAWLFTYSRNRECAYNVRSKHEKNPWFDCIHILLAHTHTQKSVKKRALKWKMKKNKKSESISVHVDAVHCLFQLRIFPPFVFCCFFRLQFYPFDQVTKATWFAVAYTSSMHLFCPMHETSSMVRHIIFLFVCHFLGSMCLYRIHLISTGCVCIFAGLCLWHIYIGEHCLYILCAFLHSIALFCLFLLPMHG